MSTTKMIGYKVAQHEGRVLITLEIPDDAITNMNRKKIVNKQLAKYRTNKAKVLKIEDSNGKEYESATTLCYKVKSLTYTVGETIEEPTFDMDLDIVCSAGIHFFLDREVAEQYENHPRNGPYKVWYASGGIYQECTFKDGKLNGLWKQWHENGQMYEECLYKDDTIDGPYKAWYANGQIYQECTYKDGSVDGLYKTWHENGRIWKERTYKHGTLDGPYKEWYGNGQLYINNIYADGKFVA